MSALTDRIDPYTMSAHYFSVSPKQPQKQSPPWECTRCGQVNAWWRASCTCKPSPAFLAQRRAMHGRHW